MPSRCKTVACLTVQRRGAAPISDPWRIGLLTIIVSRGQWPAKSAGSSGGREPDAAACVRCGDAAVQRVRHISRRDGSRRHRTPQGGVPQKHAYRSFKENEA